MTTRRHFIQYGIAAGAASLSPWNLIKLDDEKPKPASKPLKILFLGGTGFLGPHQVECAIKRGHTVTLYNRGKSHPGLFPTAERLIGDRSTNDYESIKKAIASGRKWDVVIDNSAYLPRQVAQAMAAVAGAVNHYIFISTISVFGEGLKPGSDESGPLAKTPDPTTEKVTGETYGALKALCEEAAEKGMPGKVANIRPTLIVGPGDDTDRFNYWPVRIDRGGPVLAPGDGLDPVQIIDVRDLAEWCIHVAENNICGVFNAAGPEKTLTMKAMLDGVCEGLGKKTEFVWADHEFLTKNKVSAWQDMPVWIPRQTPDAAQSQVSNARAVKAGLKFRSVPVTARETLAWCKTRTPDSRPARGPKPGLTPEREAEILKLLAPKKD
ncbi:MAG: NAD-dependent epimerase/dehydratase family protein [Planctomycetes bacterium]|nr:NAD-dependent epimerase/dehydratase family protein [Planctomycetota bacterium]